MKANSMVKCYFIALDVGLHCTALVYLLWL